MYSKHHFLVSVVAGAILAGVYGDSVIGMVLVVGYAASLGVLIDLDHFVIARITTGSWESLRGTIRSPVRSTLDQGDIFPEAAISREDRILTHLLIGGVLVGGLWPLWPTWGIVTAIVVYLHLLTDAIADVLDLY